MDSRATRFIDQQDKIILELKTMNTSSLILSVVLSVLFLVINLCRK